MVLAIDQGEVALLSCCCLQQGVGQQGDTAAGVMGHQFGDGGRGDAGTVEDGNTGDRMLEVPCR